MIELMKKLYTFNLAERSLAALLKEILTKEGIDCILKNEQLITGMGEIPFVECYPELWLIDDEVYPRARLFVDNWLKNDAGGDGPWVCTECGEIHEAQFGACWSCGRERDSIRK